MNRLRCAVIAIFTCSLFAGSCTKSDGAGNINKATSAPRGVYTDILRERMQSFAQSRPAPAQFVTISDGEKKELYDLLDAAVQDPAGKIGRAAIRGLVDKGSRAIAYLLDASNDSSITENHRIQAARILENFTHHEQAAEAAMRIVENSNVVSVRAVAAYALGRIGSRCILARLILRLKTEPSDQVALWICDSLANLGNFSGSYTLVEILQRGTLQETVSVIINMGRRHGMDIEGNDDAGEATTVIHRMWTHWYQFGTPLINLPLADPAAEARYQYDLAMHTFNLGNHDLRFVDESRYVLARAGIDALPHLTAALDDASPFARVRAIEVLGSIGPPARECVPKLIELAKNEQHLAEPLIALGKISDARATEILLASLNSNKVEITIAALRGLTFLRDPKAVPELTKFLANNRVINDSIHQEMSFLASLALAKLCNKESIQFLVEYAQKPNTSEPWAIDDALIQTIISIRAAEGDSAIAVPTAARKDNIELLVNWVKGK
ncbi:MAG: HEAT repeat domain-containing protein [Planctomycetota bacterium]